MREQIASGALVLREMTHTERAKWAKQRSALEAKLTPAERTRRDAILRERRRRTDHTLARGFERTTYSDVSRQPPAAQPISTAIGTPIRPIVRRCRKCERRAPHNE